MTNRPTVMSRRIVFFAALTAFIGSFALAGCGMQTSTDYPAGTAYDLSQNINYLNVSGADTNAMNVTVGICGNTVNIPCATVTICYPGSTTNCTTVDNILIDTGSYGLRVFSSKISSLGLTPVASGSDSLAECVGYLDGSGDWGSVDKADVYMGNSTSALKAASVPIQVIDSDYSDYGNEAADDCSGYSVELDTSPGEAGFNGILGVGLEQYDCGSNCVSDSSLHQYFACTGSTCTKTTVSEANQVQNPVSFLGSSYNNGIALELPGVPDGGAVNAPGYLIFGIGTESGGSTTADNTPSSGVNVYAADSNSGDETYLTMYTVFNGTTLSSFIDSGSNGLYFPGASSLTICSGELGEDEFYCPGSTISLGATDYSFTSSDCSSGNCSGGGNSVSFLIDDASDDFDSSNPNLVFNGLGADLEGEFDWGLPFFLGRTIFVGIDGASATINGSPYTGPYFAF